MSLGVGILSWKGKEALSVSLASYRRENLFSLFSEKTIFLPEQRPAETRLAGDYGLTVYGASHNLGILGGFKALAECLTSDIILLLENDCPLVENFTETKRQISYGEALLKNGEADIVRFRSRRAPGQDWSVYRKYHAYYPPADASFYAKSRATLLRALRPGKADKIRGLSIYANEAEAAKNSDIIRYDKENDTYFLTSAYLHWTNQSIMLKRDFFLKTIIAYAETAPTIRRINGFKNLEIEMNSDFWRKNAFNIAVPKGLFTHARIGDRGYKI